MKTRCVTTPRIDWTGIKLAATYLGAVVGAGFASGQEHLHFFGQFSPGGELGVGMAGVLFVVFGVLLADLVSRHRTSSPEDLLGHIAGKAMTPVVDGLLTAFMFCSVCIMLAGTVALLKEQTSLPPHIGVGLTALVILIACTRGVEGVLYLNAFMSPVLLGAPILVATLSLVQVRRGLLRPPCTPAPEVIGRNSLLPAWPVASVLYVSYNLLIVIGTFASMGNELARARAARRGAAMGGVALTLFMAAIHVTLAVHGDAVWTTEVPMLLAASRLGPGLRGLYSISLWCAMVTTAATGCFSLSRRLEKRLRLPQPAIAILVTILAALLAQVGFASLVSRVYPVFGYLGLPLVFGIALATIRSRVTIMR
ncbi:MAG: hypothetical protein QME92_02905 [Bacillota bacterium]|nr:hypothetical protein [Bacillota bacterium]